MRGLRNSLKCRPSHAAGTTARVREIGSGRAGLDNEWTTRSSVGMDRWGPSPGTRIVVPRRSLRISPEIWASRISRSTCLRETVDATPVARAAREARREVA